VTLVGAGRPRGGYGRGALSASDIAGCVATSQAREGLVGWALYSPGAAEERRHSAAVGDAVHAAIALYESGEVFAASDVISAAPEGAAEAWATWLRWRECRRELECVAVEWPTVAAIAGQRVGGTVDAVYRGPDGLIVADWKTGRVTPSVALTQCAIYALLWRATTGERVAEGRACGLGRRARDWTEARCSGDTWATTLRQVKRLIVAVATLRGLDDAAPSGRVGEPEPQEWDELFAGDA
jgi:hypothetical protein